MSNNLQDYFEVGPSGTLTSFSSVAHLHQLLNAEQHVQVDKLREHARHGIAPKVRGEVWLYLLDVLSADKTSEITSLRGLNRKYQALSSSLPSDLTSLLLKTALAHHTHRFFSPTYADLISSITAEPLEPVLPLNPVPTAAASTKLPSAAPIVNGNTNPSPPTERDEPPEGEAAAMQRPQFLLPPPPDSPPSRHAYLSILEEVLGKHANSEEYCEARSRGREWDYNHDDEKDWVYLATPFLCCLSRPVAVFLGFQNLMQKLDTFPPVPSRLASLLTLFRFALPELHSYFEDEQVPFYEVALCWLRTLLAREMWLGDVLRLWDAYLAADDMFALHCYVCVAILGTCKETLEELDGSEAKLMLLDLPPMDVDRLLQDAGNLKVAFPLPRPASPS
ncbi:hypothetical protein P7C73_g1408, partial [Tremellales sp. Uapishka_1]